jgi:hypothetical protein
VKTWHWVVIGIVVLAIIGGIAGGDEDSGDGGGGSADTSQPEEQPEGESPPATRFRATAAQVERLFNDTLGAESGGNPRVKDAVCTRGACVVNYRSKEIVFGQDEVLRDQIPIWKMLFSDRKLKRATLIPHSTVTSVGGKESNEPILRVTCDRAANRQIDWDNVDEDGIKALCAYRELVRFD